MTRKRLRAAYSPADLRELYATPHDHRRWPDHHLRVNVTIQVGRWLAGDTLAAAADLSCGNGTILDAMPAATRLHGDYAPGWDYTGPLERTLNQIPPVDLYVCSETLEHLDDPDKALAKIRDRTRMLLLSTPVEAWDDDNPEHYWAWSRTDVEDMLAAAGFRPVVYTAVDFRPAGLPYCFGVWGAR
jgi:hypothetical protein